MTTQAPVAPPATAEEIYNQIVKPLPPSERLKLATMILGGISPHSIVDYSDDWSDEDLREATLYSMRRAAESLGEDEEDAETG